MVVSNGRAGGTNGPNTARADGPNVRGMSTSIECPGLIVGVDGSAASKAAVDWAARDASMRSVPLTLVHVASGLAGTWPQTPPPIGFGEWQQQRGRRIIDEAVSIVEEANTGGMTCHAAIVARELGVPCVVGTRTATRDLLDGTTVTVDGTHGQVVSGRVEASPAVSVADRRAPAEPQAEVTGTKVYVNLAMPETAEAVAAQGPDGVGLLRAEFMLTEAFGGRHPRDLIAHGEQNALVAGLVTPLLRIASTFAPRPVVYRATDFRTNEFRGLKGGDAYGPEEHYPMIGYRGCYRYVKEPDLFAVELQALARVREQSPNVHVMIPFVRTRWELEKCLALVDASPLGRQRGLHRWVMAEVPSVVHWLPEYIGMGIDGVSIGSNDLTQLVLGVDRDSDVCAELLDEPILRCWTPSGKSLAPHANSESPPRCAGRPRRPTRRSPNTSSGWASRRCRSTRTRSVPPGARSPRPNGGCCWNPLLDNTTSSE